MKTLIARLREVEIAYGKTVGEGGKVMSKTATSPGTISLTVRSARQLKDLATIFGANFIS